MISKYQVIDIALDAIQGRNYIISGDYEELPELSRCNSYQNWSDQPAWYVFFRVDYPNLLCSTPMENTYEERLKAGTLPPVTKQN